MPNRILKETICTSDTIDQLSAEEERFFYRLMTKCDDFGRFDGRPTIVMTACFPLKVAKRKILERQVEQWMVTLAESGLIERYTFDGKEYIQMLTWSKHQSVRAKASKYPDPPASTCEQMQAHESECKDTRPYSYSYSYSRSNSSTPSSQGDKGKAKVSSEALTLATTLYDFLKKTDAVPASRGWFMKQAGIAENVLLTANHPLEEWTECLQWAMNDPYWESHLVSLKQLGETVWSQYARNGKPKSKVEPQPFVPKIDEVARLLAKLQEGDDVQ